MTDAKDKRIAELEDQLNALQGMSPDLPIERSYPEVSFSGPSAGKVVLHQVGQAYLHAGKARVGAELNKKLVTMAKVAAGDRLPDNPIVDAVLALLIPVGLLYGTEILGSLGHKSVPRRLVSGVNATATAALAGVSQDTVDSVVSNALPLLSEVAQLGAGMLAQLQEGDDGQTSQLHATTELG